MWLPFRHQAFHLLLKLHIILAKTQTSPGHQVRLQLDEISAWPLFKGLEFRFDLYQAVLTFLLLVF